jgi:hypothetical protein
MSRYAYLQSLHLMTSSHTQRILMSDFKEFARSETIRHPITLCAVAIGGIYGGLDMFWKREAKRAAGEELQFSWLWLDRIVDFLFGATVQVVYCLCAVWVVALLMDKTNVWLRQATLVALYLGFNWLTHYL